MSASLCLCLFYFICLPVLSFVLLNHVFFSFVFSFPLYFLFSFFFSFLFFFLFSFLIFKSRTRDSRTCRVDQSVHLSVTSSKYEQFFSLHCLCLPICNWGSEHGFSKFACKGKTKHATVGLLALALLRFCLCNNLRIETGS